VDTPASAATSSNRGLRCTHTPLTALDGARIVPQI
jgi:hypothetical protein